MKHPHTCNTTHWHMQHHAVSCHTLQHTANTLQHIAFACFHPAHTRHDALHTHNVPRCNTPSLVTCCQKSCNIRQERHTAYTSHYPIRQYCMRSAFPYTNPLDLFAKESTSDERTSERSVRNSSFPTPTKKRIVADTADTDRSVILHILRTQNEVSATICFQPQQRILAAILSPTSSTAHN